jgi:hypothetical protein
MANRAPVLALSMTLVLSGCVAPETSQETAEFSPATIESNEAETAEPRERRPEPKASEAFDTLWPSGFSRRELADTAIAKAYAFFEKREVGASERLLTIVHQETVSDFHREWTNDLAKLTVDVFADSLDEEILFVTGTDVEFLDETLESWGLPLHPGGVDTSNAYVCGAYQGWAYVSLLAFAHDRMPRSNLTACVPHEIFHVVQDSLDKAPGSQVFPPGHEHYRAHWFVEGSAQFVGHALASYAGYYRYWGVHETMNNSDLLEERPYLRGFETWERGWESYRWGQLATEYIVANKGVESLMDIWALLGAGETFESAFEKALGISVTDFYDAFDRMNQEMTSLY